MKGTTSAFEYDARGYPVVDAVLGECGGCLSFYCPYCRHRHFHGLPEGHRVAHCSNPNSPFRERGYFLRQVPGVYPCGHPPRTTPRGRTTPERTQKRA